MGCSYIYHQCYLTTINTEATCRVQKKVSARSRFVLGKRKLFIHVCPWMYDNDVNDNAMVMTMMSAMMMMMMMICKELFHLILFTL